VGCTSQETCACVLCGCAGEWCWISSDDAVSRALRYACFYGLVWLAFAAATAAHVRVWLSLRRFVAMGRSLQPDTKEASPPPRHSPHSASAGGRSAGSPPEDAHLLVVRRLMASLKFYPVIFLAAWLPASAFRLAEDVGWLSGGDGGSSTSNDGDGASATRSLAYSLFVAWSAQTSTNSWINILT
jgi:hypothetical protein